jgi:hypothetical protein
MTQICQQFSPLLSSVRTLRVSMLDDSWYHGERKAHWVDFLRVFNHVEKLHLNRSSSRYAAYALKPLPTETATDVLPALRELHIIGSSVTSEWREALTSFIDARNLAGLPAIILHKGDTWP